LSAGWEHEAVAWIAKTLPVNLSTIPARPLLADSGFKVQLPETGEINKNVSNFRLLFEFLAGQRNRFGTLVPGKALLTTESNFGSLRQIVRRGQQKILDQEHVGR